MARLTLCVQITTTTSRRHYSSNIEVLTTGVEPAVRAEAENSLAHTLELRFLKMFEFEDEEGVFYDVLVNSEKLRNSYFINFCFVQVRRLSGKLGASVAAKQELLHRLCQLFVVRNVLMR